MCLKSLSVLGVAFRNSVYNEKLFYLKSTPQVVQSKCKTSKNITNTIEMVDVKQKTVVTFQGSLDRFNGVTVSSDVENCKVEEFSQKLQDSLKQWTTEQKRGIWFKVKLDNTDWVPVLATNGFKFHHAHDDFVMMYKWLPQNESCNIPTFAHTMLGVGGVVLKDGKILVVSEKYFTRPHWKLPGGYVNRGENLVEAVIREIHEETNIMTEFETLLSIRHTHGGMFDCSDIYTTVGLKPISDIIRKSEREINECKWMDVDEFLNHPYVHDLNRFFVNKYLDYKQNNIRIECTHGVHQVLKKPYTVFHVVKDKT